MSKNQFLEKYKKLFRERIRHFSLSLKNWSFQVSKSNLLGKTFFFWANIIIFWAELFLFLWVSQMSVQGDRFIQTNGNFFFFLKNFLGEVEEIFRIEFFFGEGLFFRIHFALLLKFSCRFLTLNALLTETLLWNKHYHETETLPQNKRLQWYNSRFISHLHTKAVSSF